MLLTFHLFPVRPLGDFVCLMKLMSVAMKQNLSFPKPIFYINFLSVKTNYVWTIMFSLIIILSEKQCIALMQTF